MAAANTVLKRPNSASSAAESLLGGFGSGSASAASLGANQADFFGDSGGAALGTGAGAAPGQGITDADRAARITASADRWGTAKNLEARDPSGGAGYDPTAAKSAFDSGNIGGASGAYNSVNDSGKANYDYLHSLGTPGFASPTDALNSMGERVGISHAGDVADPLAGGIINPLDMLKNPGGTMLGSVMDPNKGLGTTVGSVGGASGGKPVTNLSNGTRDLAHAMQDGSIAAGIGDIFGGGNSGSSYDTSGGDRGAMAFGGQDALSRNQGLGDQMRAQGSGVLGGSVAPGGQGAAQQQDALDAAMSFQGGPRATSSALAGANAFNPQAQTGVMGALGDFTKQQAPASAAQALLQKGQQGAMADVLAASRSGRARDAGSQARASNVAQGEIAGMGVDAARDAATLKAQEDQANRGQQLQALGQQAGLASGIDQSKLSALGLSGQLSQGLDSDTLKALGLQGDIAGQMRSANTAERGQTLGYDQGQNQIGAGLDSDVLKTIPGLEGIRHSDQFDLTPQQKLEQAKLAGGPSKTTTDYVTGLLGDVLSAI